MSHQTLARRNWSSVRSAGGGGGGGGDPIFIQPMTSSEAVKQPSEVPRTAESLPPPSGRCLEVTLSAALAVRGA